MPATLDLDAVRRFTDDLNDQLRKCDTSEGMICSTLDESINYYAQLCLELRAFIQEWAHAIFTNESMERARLAPVHFLDELRRPLRIPRTAREQVPLR